MHFNAEGVELVADLVVAHIQERGLLDSSQRDPEKQAIPGSLRQLQRRLCPLREATLLPV